MRRRERLRRVPAVGLCIAALAALSLTACRKQADILTDPSFAGEIAVISREEGSGTRTEFEMLIGSAAAGSDAFAESTDEMLAQVQAETCGIGYLAVSAVTEAEGIRVLAIDGIKPEKEAITSEKYPLCRNYHLAYQGELSEVESDFLRYILSAGQDIVAESCFPVRQAESFLSDKSTGNIRISGSSSIGPMMQKLAEDYKTCNPNAEITVEITDSTSGLTAAIRGECDLAMSSRSLKDYEAELLEDRIIAADGIAVIVNQENPLEDISVRILKEIYDGAYTNWSDLSE